MPDMPQTPASWAAHENRLLIAQGAAQIWIDVDDLPSLILEAVKALKEPEKIG